VILRGAEYVVPKRFGLSAILGITTALSLLFGLLRFNNAEPEVYLFFGLLTAICCLLQMFFGDVPRLASLLAGAGLLFLFSLVAGTLAEHGPRPGRIICLAIGSLPIGAALGYITGTCAAGVFLVMDSLEAHFPGGGMKQPVGLPRTATTRETMSESDLPADAPDPSARPLGPPAAIPVFNCRVLVSAKDSAGLVLARAAEVAGIEARGPSEREALQQVVAAFKALVKQHHESGTQIPWLAEPLARQPGDQERFIAVHL
jgi:hypothetical protein